MSRTIDSGAGFRRLQGLGPLPGLLVVVALAWLSFSLSEFIGTRLLGMAKSPVSPVMLAIILGIVLRNTIRLPVMLAPGIRIAVKKILRWGIILLGLRLSVVEVFRLGAMGIPVVLLCIAAALLVSTTLARITKLPGRLGTLIAVGTSICGVSAIVATGPAIDASDDEISYGVSVITVFGLLATVLYPLLSHMIFDGNSMMAGMFLGTSIHDTSQVTGAALLYSDLYMDETVLNFAVVSKLTRNVFMALVVPAMAIRYARRTFGVRGNTKDQPDSGESRRSRSPVGRLRQGLRHFPTFILGFLGLAILRSLMDAAVNAGLAYVPSADLWNTVLSVAQLWAIRLLVVALAGVGLQTDIRNLRKLGARPFLVGLATAVTVGLVSIGGILIVSL